ncbi:hypothetical protein ASZ90_010334 [hydrocarbon metagenome]|uniref:Uncharacterized protein n=1 Tax=hydrocarbon metagenome TaxID=938273 RepID=A0A0W8FGA3_9ZZZZ
MRCESERCIARERSGQERFREAGSGGLQSGGFILIRIGHHVRAKDGLEKPQF